jgi:hypothetical protein
MSGAGTANSPPTDLPMNVLSEISKYTNTTTKIRLRAANKNTHKIIPLLDQDVLYHKLITYGSFDVGPAAHMVNAEYQRTKPSNSKDTDTVHDIYRFHAIIDTNLKQQRLRKLTVAIHRRGSIYIFGAIHYKPQEGFYKVMKTENVTPTDFHAYVMSALRAMFVRGTIHQSVADIYDHAVKYVETIDAPTSNIVSKSMNKPDAWQIILNIMSERTEETRERIQELNKKQGMEDVLGHKSAATLYLRTPPRRAPVVRRSIRVQKS